jgi:hypothetical protein
LLSARHGRALLGHFLAACGGEMCLGYFKNGAPRKEIASQSSPLREFIPHRVCSGAEFGSSRYPIWLKSEKVKMSSLFHHMRSHMMKETHVSPNLSLYVIAYNERVVGGWVQLARDCGASRLLD